MVLSHVLYSFILLSFWLHTHMHLKVVDIPLVFKCANADITVFHAWFLSLSTLMHSCNIVYRTNVKSTLRKYLQCKFTLECLYVENTGWIYGLPWPRFCLAHVPSYFLPGFYLALFCQSFLHSLRYGPH